MRVKNKKKIGFIAITITVLELNNKGHELREERAEHHTLILFFFRSTGRAGVQDVELTEITRHFRVKIEKKKRKLLKHEPFTVCVSNDHCFHLHDRTRAYQSCQHFEKIASTFQDHFLQEKSRRPFHCCTSVTLTDNRGYS